MNNHGGKMNNSISKSFIVFNDETPEHAKCWQELTGALTRASALDSKTHHLAYLAVLAVLRRENGIPFHVKMAKQAGASRDEILSAILVGLPPAGHVVTEVLPAAIDAFDKENKAGQE